jgi:hypothetical protein
VPARPLPPMPGRAVAVLLVAAAFTCGGCSVAYVPGDQAQQKANAADARQLHSLVLVLANLCTKKEIGGTVTNRSTSTLRVVVVGQMLTPAGAQKEVSVSVKAPRGATVQWRAPAPPGTTPQGGCQEYAKSIGVVGG